MPPSQSLWKRSLMVALEAAEEGLDGLPIPGVKGCIAGIILLVEQEELRKSNVELLEKLRSKIQSVQDIVVKPVSQLTPEETPDKLKKDVQTFADKLRSLPEGYAKAQAPPTSRRERIKTRIRDFVRAGENEELLEDLAHGIDEAVQLFQLSADVTNQVSQHRTVQLLEADHCLRHLPEAPTGHRNEVCEEGTRTSILSDAVDWAKGDEPDMPRVLWLHGPAGSGKSTVASTLANRFFADEMLGGQFVFSRASGIVDAGLVFPALAQQLAQHDHAFKVHLSRSIQTNPEHLRRARIAEQFEYLMLRPLLKLSPSRPVITIVLDALDECDRRDDVEKIFSLLLDNVHRFPFLRIFVTSRREDYIGRVALQHQDKIRGVDINRASATDDIRLYLRKRLFDRFEKDNDVAGAWPSSADLETLVKRSNDLFIYAATAARFIMEGEGEATDPQKNLERLLQDQNPPNKNIFSSLDFMYSAIVQKALPEDAYEETVERFRDILGIIIFNPKPVSVNKIIELSAGKYTTRDIRLALHCLHSVIVVPEDNAQSGIHALHKSFVDFITDPARCTVKAACLEENRAHKDLFKRYLNVLPEMRGWSPAQVDRKWDFTKLRPQDFRTYLLDLERYHDLPDLKYSDADRRAHFVESIKDQLSSPLPPAELPVSPRFNHDSPSEVVRRIDLVSSSIPSDPMSFNLREGDPPLIISGMTDNPPTGGQRVTFNSVAVAPIHADIFVDGDGMFFVQDSGSGRATFLNSVRINMPKIKSAPHPLEHGDVLQFGVDTVFGNTAEFKCITVTVELPGDESLDDDSDSVSMTSTLAADDPQELQQIWTDEKNPLEHDFPDPDLPGSFPHPVFHGTDELKYPEHPSRPGPFGWFYICVIILLMFDRAGRDDPFVKLLHSLFLLESI